MNILLCIIIVSGFTHLVKARDARGLDISGDGSVVTIGKELPTPLIFEAVDDSGRPVGGMPVNLSFISVPSRVEESYVRMVFCDTTDSKGYAIFRLHAGNVEGKYLLEATSPLSNERVAVSFVALRKNFPVFLLIGLIGGFAIFMYGLNFGSKALTRISGGKLREFLWRLTKNPLLGVVVGVFITILTQSSSATTVMLVSFAEAGLVNFFQTLGVILGADIGTTFTVQLIAFKIFDIALIIVAVGFFMMIFSKGRRIHYAGRIIFSFGLIFFGMKLMTEAVSPLTLIPGFTERLIGAGDRPFLLLLISAIFTGIIQSSGATMALVVSFGFAGLVDITGAIPIIFGANIGTCATALLASIKRSTEAKRVAMAHILFKILIVILFFPFIDEFASLVTHTSTSLPRQIANAHTLFNVFATAIFLPLLFPYSLLIKRLLPLKKVEYKPHYLDRNLISSPAIAFGQAIRETLRMADVVQSMLDRSMEVLKTNEELERLKIVKDDDIVDNLEQDIRLYLVSLSEEEITTELSKKSAALLHIIDELEHIGDVISKSITSYARKKIKKGFVFSEEGFMEIKTLFLFSKETLRMAVDAIATYDTNLAQKVSTRVDEGKVLLSKYHDSHLDRLRKGVQESVETSTVHLDLITDLERINFHASNIGRYIMESR